MIPVASCVPPPPPSHRAISILLILVEVSDADTSKSHRPPQVTLCLCGCVLRSKRCSLTAAFISSDTSGEEEIEIEAETVAEECTIVGSAFELKLLAGSNFGQLAANMLKLAADLCVQCIKGGNVLIKEINSYLWSTD